MVNPKLRILLVDEEYSRLTSIEKNLSWLGYSHVAPLTSFRELLVILDNALLPFDLLIVHQSLLDSAGKVLEQSVRSSPAVKHLLIYQGSDVQIRASIESSAASMRFTLACPPDRESIRQVMNFIDVAEFQTVHAK